jgi:hypothetical protein
LKWFQRAQRAPLHKPGRSTPPERESPKREIEGTDSQIVRLVYELCGLAEEEIRIVERT